MKKPEQRNGFTILELLVAASISVILIGLFLTISSNILDAWTVSRDSLSSNAKARIALDTLATDLESAILRSDQGVWLACDLLQTTATSGRWESGVQQKPAGESSLEIDLADPGLRAEDYRFGVAGFWIRFFGSATDASGAGNSGDVQAIAYQLIRRKPHSRSTDADESYNLYRSIVRADHTLKEVVEDGGYYIDEFDGNSYEGQPGEITTPRNDSSLFIRDVVDVGMVFYREDSVGNEEILFPKPGGIIQFRVPQDGLPSSVEIFVRILDEEGAKQLGAYERGLIPTTDPDFWWKTVDQYSTVYSRRVHFITSDL